MTTSDNSKTGETIAVSLYIQSKETPPLFKVTSNASWAVTTTDSWIHVGSGSHTANDLFSYSVDENTTGVDRTGTITFYIDPVEKEDTARENTTSVVFSITQAPTGTMGISPTTVHLEAVTTNPVGIQVTSNTYWYATTDSEWIVLPEGPVENPPIYGGSYLGNHLFTEYEPAENTGPARTGHITFRTVDGTEKVLTVVQHEPGYQIED